MVTLSSPENKPTEEAALCDIVQRKVQNATSCLTTGALVEQELAQGPAEPAEEAGEGSLIDKLDKVRLNGQKAQFFNPGRFVDVYTREELIGRGVTSKVYKCTNNETGERWAVKILEKKLLKKEDVNRFLKEIYILKNLDHPHIVRVYEYLQDEERVYIIMECLRGRELFSEINNRRKNGARWTERQAARVLFQILLVLDYLHQNEICFRDVKPENIMFSNKRTDEIKFIDFGCAEMVSWRKGEKLSRQYGSPYYIAPEVLKCKYDVKADVWSAGVILFCLLMARMPFDGREDRMILARIQNMALDFSTKEFTKKSVESVDILKRMLIKVPEARLSAAQCI